ncbi:DUF1365 domain-containing protein [Luteibacter yeojuensis]|nr:DUF1365 domain-containing protein [Luteibacter yeojuensis]
MNPLASAVYEGHVVHRRHAPHPHAFRYAMAQLYLDLDEIEQVFRQHALWSAHGRNLAEWRRSDYLGPTDLSLTDAVRERVRAAVGDVPGGPVRMLAHPRYAGYVFNPVSFYYCYETDGRTLACIVAEVTNTPWGERHAYVLPVDSARRRGRAFAWDFDKQFHVSPFMTMDSRYDWRFTPPSDDLRVHMKVLRNETLQFDATLSMRRRPVDRRTLGRLLWRYPLMTAQVMGAIHWQALRLWLKRNPSYDHPGAQSSTLRESS